MTAPLTELSALVRRAHEVRRRARPGQRAVLGIAGAPGAGKSTVATALLDALRADPPVGADPDWVAHLPMDGYHLADATLERLGLRERKGAPETFDVDGFVAALARVRAVSERPVYVPGFERELEQPLAAALVVDAPARLVVTEGNYLLLAEGGWEQVRPLLDEVWFVDVDPELRRERLRLRHVRFGKSIGEAAAWVHAVDEPNARLVGASRRHADLVVGVRTSQK